MKLLTASVLVSVSGIVAMTAFAQQQSPFGATAVPGQTTTSANQGIATSPGGQQGLITTADPNASAIGGIPTNSSGGSAFGLGATNQIGVGATNGLTGTAPLFLNVTATTITDANGSPIGVLQQLALSPSGQINFGIVNSGGRLVPVPWQLIVNSTSGTRGALALNAAPGALQSAPPVLMGHLPALTQSEVQNQILSAFGLQPATSATPQPTIVTTGTARGGTGGAGVTITGGSPDTGTFGLTSSTNSTAATTNGVRTTNGIPNNMLTNQAVNTTAGLLSPTGRTNGIFDPYNSGPGSFDRMGPRQNANPTQPRPVITPPVNSGQGQPQPQQ